MWLPLLAKPVVGAAIGWFTNFLAIRMLFRPQRPLRLLGMTLQGVVPRRRQEIAARVAETVERELVSHDDIRDVLLDIEYQRALRRRIEEHVRDYLDDKLAGTPKVVQKLVSNGLVDRIASGAAGEVMERLPALIDGAADELRSRLDIREVIQAKIDAFDLDQMEALVQELARKELRFIEILGGIVGFLVGAAFALLEHALR
jgi:uncharacterized membrane protein YheB (UPF0754 family)